MARKRFSVKELSIESGLDLDEVIVQLWDLGIENIAEPSDFVPNTKIKEALKIFGLPTRREISSSEYWQKRFNLNSEAFGKLLNELNIVIPKGSNKLPKGAISKFSKKIKQTMNFINTKNSILNINKEVSIKNNVVYKWENIGHPKELRMLTYDEVLNIHFELVKDFAVHSDPIEPSGIRSENLLASAVFRPNTSINTKLKYPTVEMSAAALLHSLVQDHPFHNGNKRTAIVAMLVFLDENGVILTCSEDEIFKIVLQLAQHKLVIKKQGLSLSDFEVLEIARCIASNSRLIEKGDHPIQWRRLKQILSSFNCGYELPDHSGRINIWRETEKKSIWKNNKLQTQVFYGDDGRQADTNTISKIRKDLHLDDINGIDSGAFYKEISISPGDFIVKYRKLLKRLSRL